MLHATASAKIGGSREWAEEAVWSLVSSLTAPKEVAQFLGIAEAPRL